MNERELSSEEIIERRTGEMFQREQRAFCLRALIVTAIILVGLVGSYCLLFVS